MVILTMSFIEFSIFGFQKPHVTDVDMGLCVHVCFMTTNVKIKNPETTLGCTIFGSANEENAQKLHYPATKVRYARGSKHCP